MAVHVDKRKDKPADPKGRRAPSRPSRAEDSNRTNRLSSDVKRVAKPARRELDADGLLAIARSIPPEVAAQLEAFFEAEKKVQVRLQRRTSVR